MSENKLWAIFWIMGGLTIMSLILSMLAYNIVRVIYECGGG